MQTTADRRAIDDAIRLLPPAWFRPSPLVYWTDLIVSAAIGWVALVFAVRMSGWPRLVLLGAAIFALYRATLFIHEITHLAPRKVPGFTAAWNLLVGVPLLVPSFLYRHVHTDHHRQRTYGTEDDPEYFPFARRPPALIVGSLVASLLAPAAFVFRFGVLAPLSWLIPAVRQFTLAHASALAINHRYVRRTPIDGMGRLEEAGSCAVVWGTIVLWQQGVLPTTALWCWGAAVSVAFGVNAVRTLAAHRYDYDAHELTAEQQLLDSCTVAAGSPLSAIWAPVGLRYHALHHWIPSLPYHNLGRAHRRLAAELPADAPYRDTFSPSLAPALASLVRRSRASRN